MAPLVRRPCLYQEQGCNWMTQECDQITTIAEAEIYVKLHGTDCIHNPAVVQANTLKQQRWEAENTRQMVAEEAEAARRRLVNKR